MLLGARPAVEPGREPAPLYRATPGLLAARRDHEHDATCSLRRPWSESPSTSRTTCPAGSSSARARPRSTALPTDVFWIGVLAAAAVAARPPCRRRRLAARGLALHARATTVSTSPPPAVCSPGAWSSSTATGSAARMSATRPLRRPFRLVVADGDRRRAARPDRAGRPSRPSFRGRERRRPASRGRPAGARPRRTAHPASAAREAPPVRCARCPTLSSRSPSRSLSSSPGRSRPRSSLTRSQPCSRSTATASSATRFDGRRLTLREGSLRRRWSEVDPAGVVAFELRSSPGQRRAGLCTFAVHLGQGAGSRRALDLGEGQAAVLLAGLDPPLLAPLVASSRPNA